MKSFRNLDYEKIKLYAITDRRWSDSDETFYAKIEESLKGGVGIVQMREKNMDIDSMIEEATRIKKLCHKYNALFIVNDNIEVAKRVGADGVHLGQDDDSINFAREALGSLSVIGVSAGNLSEAVEAQNKGADYIGVGAVFSTETKLDADAIKSEVFKEISHTVDIPIVAIGGITFENIKLLESYNTNGVAIISDIYSKDICEIKSHCRLILKEVEALLGEKL